MVLFLKPYMETKVWAGNELNNIYECKEGTGEAWIVSGYNKKSSIILNGKYKNQTLRHVWRKHPELFGPIAYNEKEFPILIKLISANDDLSVQVHPDDDYALERHNALGKFECWYIMDENKAKTATLGIDAKNKPELEDIIAKKIVSNYLINKEIKPNDLVIVEPGTVHALHKGSFILEIQESSNLTYRLYDYDRSPRRPLNITDALNVIHYNDKSNNILPFKEEGSYKSSHFNLYKLFVNGEKTYDNKGFEIFYILNGRGSVDGNFIQKGDVFILTDEKESLLFEGDLEMIAVVPMEKATRTRMRKSALITGVTGQDGLYLLDLLLEKGYEVHIVLQNTSDLTNPDLVEYFENDEIMDQTLFVHFGDLIDGTTVTRVIEEVRPDEIYHLASQSRVDLSYDQAEYTTEVNCIGTLKILECIRQNELNTKLFSLSTPYLFDGSIIPQNEDTPFNPTSPYAISKLYTQNMVKLYRDNYAMYAVSGIFYNHESKKRKFGYVSKKIIDATKRVKKGKKFVLHLGNLDIYREWGFTEEYAKAMWLMLQQQKPKDYVVGTGVVHSIREFAEEAYRQIGIELLWDGSGINEVGKNKETGDILIVVDSKYVRLAEPKTLKSDPTRFNTDFDFKLTDDLEKLICEMKSQE